jgi:hypothetical protein
MRGRKSYKVSHRLLFQNASERADKQEPDNGSSGKLQKVQGDAYQGGREAVDQAFIKKIPERD